MASDGTIKISTELDTKDAQKAMSQFSGETQKGFSGVKTAVAAMSAAVAAAAVAAMAAVIKLGSEFYAQMSVVQSISGATTGELEKLTEKAKYMGATTQFSAMEAGQAMEYMAMAGWKTKDMISGLDGIMYAAGASGESLAMVSDIVTDGLTAFGLSAKESGRFADVLAAASSNANTNIGMMGETFKYVAPVAGAMGYSIEDTSVAIGLMANSGIKASQAGTSLRQILLGMQGGVELTGDAFGKTRIEVENADGSMRELNDVVVDLRSAFGQMTEAEKASNAEVIAGKVGMSGLLAVVNAGEGDFNKLTAAIADSAGTAQRMNEVRLDNLSGDVTILDSTLQGLGIQIYDSFDSPFRTAAQGATKAINGVSKELARPEMKKSLDSIGDGMSDLAVSATKLAGKAIPPLIKTVGIVIDTFDVWAPSIVAVTTAMGAVKGITAFNKASEAARIVIDAAKASNMKMTTSIGAKVAAETMATAATKANMTINAAGQLITEAGIVATAAETTAVLASSGALSVKTVIVGAMTGQIGKATAVQILWNAAINANPIGILVAGVSLLIAGLIKATKSFVDNNEMLNKTKEKAEELKGEFDKLKSTIDSTKESYKDSTDSIDANAKKSENLVKKIKDMSSVTEKNAGQVRLLKTWISELNEVMPELNIYYDEQTGKVEGLNDATENRINLIKEEAKQEANRQYLTELYAQQAEAEIQLQIAQEELKNTAIEYGDAAYNAWKNSDELQEKSRLGFEALNGLFSPIADNVSALQEELDGVNEKIAVFEGEIENSSNTLVDSGVAALGQLNTALGDTSQAMTSFTEDETAALTSLSEEYDKLAESASNMFDKISNESELSVQEMIENLEYNQQAVSQWAENLKILAGRGIDQGLLEKLRQAGPESAALVQKIASASRTELEKLSELFEKSGTVSSQALVDSLDVKEEVALQAAGIATAADMALQTQIEAVNFKEKGSQLTGSFAEGMQTEMGAVVMSAVQISDATADITVKTKAEQDKASLNMDTYTKKVSELMGKLTTGMSDEEAKQLASWLAMVADAEMNGKAISDETLKTADEVIKNLDKMPAETRTIMKNAMNPMIEEMQKSEPTLFEKASSIANGVLSRLKKAFDIHSPSRKTRKIFQQVMQGGELGIEDEEQNLLDIVDSMSDNLLDQFSSIDFGAVIGKFNMAMNDMQSSFSPTVQLSHAMAKASRQTGDSVDDSGIDYNKMGNELKKAVSGLKVEMEGRVVGETVSPYVDKTLGRSERLKGRT